MTTHALQRMIAARTTLLLDEPFFGVPALRLVPREDPSCQTAWVDGQTLGFNPTFVTKCSAAHLKALWCHEVEHCAMGHPWRKAGRDHQKWNEACDRAINPVMRDAGYDLPEGALFELEPGHKGKSAEWIYTRLPAAATGEGGGSDGEDGQDGEETNGTGPQTDGQPSDQQSDDHGELGEVRDAPPSQEQEGLAPEDQQGPPTEEEWRQIMQQSAEMARAQGKLPGVMDRAVEQATRSRIDWRPPMRRFAQEVAKADYAWARPSVRYLAQGLYLPSMRSEEVGIVAIGVDTSGSIDQVLLQQFEAEVRAVMDEIQPRQVHVFYVDASVQRTEVFERGEQVVLHPAGGGGTDFRPLFNAVEKMDDPPVCVIYLTDLEGTFPEKDPEIPTLWVTGKDYVPLVPFGEALSASY